VLHTWTQKLEGHPHTHCLVTGGGLGQDGFISKSRYRFPIKVLRYVFKVKLLQKLRGLLKEGKLSVARYSAYQLLRDADSRTWNLDLRRPLAGPEQVIKYFARYTRRIAISDRRLVSYDGNTIVFRYRDRKDNNRVKTDKLDGPSFCRRFLSHVLPHASSASAATASSATASENSCSSSAATSSEPRPRTRPRRSRDPPPASASSESTPSAVPSATRDASPYTQPGAPHDPRSTPSSRP
jgi:hypothetical protein